MPKQTIALLSVSIFVIIFIGYSILGNDVPTTEEAKSALSGSWVYNALECNDGIEMESLYEIQIGSGLANGAMNAYRTDRDGFSYIDNDTLPKQFTELLSNTFAACAIHEEPMESPVVLRFVIDGKETHIVGYTNSQVLIKVEKDNTALLRPISRIKELVARTK